MPDFVIGPMSSASNAVKQLSLNLVTTPPCSKSLFLHTLISLVACYLFNIHTSFQGTMVQKVWRRNFAAGFGLEKALEAARSSSAPVAIQSPPGGSSPDEVSLSYKNPDTRNLC